MADSTQQMFQALQKENNALLEAQTELNTTDDRKMIYQKDSIARQMYFNNILYYVYYILAILVFVYIAYTKSLSRYFLAFYGILLLAYPYMADFIIITLINFVSYIWSLIMGVVFVPI
jgi:hypothetical protein